MGSLTADLLTADPVLTAPSGRSVGRTLPASDTCDTGCANAPAAGPPPTCADRHSRPLRGDPAERSGSGTG